MKTKNSSYRLDYLEVKNYKLIKNGLFSFEGKNLIVLDGPNGFGKTTLFEAIEVILNGKPRNINDNKNILATYSFLKSPIHTDEDLPITLKLSLINSDGENIVLERKFPKSEVGKKSRDKNIQKIYEKSTLFLNDVEFQGKLEDILSYDNIYLFNVLNYVEQDENTFFIKKNPKEKYKLLASLLGVESQIEQIDLLSKFLRSVSRRVKELDSDVAKLNIEISSRKSWKGKELTYSRLLKTVDLDWDREEIRINDVDTQNSILYELEAIKEVVQSKNHIRSISTFEVINKFKSTELLNTLISNYWGVYNLSTLQEEINQRYTLLKDKKLLSAIDYNLRSLNYEELRKKIFIDRLKNLAEFKSTEEFISQLDLIISLKSSLNSQNAILESLIEKKKVYLAFVSSNSDIIKLDKSECPTCGFNWESEDKLIRQIEETENKISGNYKEQNQLLENEKKIFNEQFIDFLQSGLSQELENIERRLALLIDENEYQRIREVENRLKFEISELFGVLNASEKELLRSLIDKRNLEDKELIKKKVLEILEENTPYFPSDTNLSKLKTNYKIYFNNNFQELDSLSIENIEEKKEYIVLQLFKTLNNQLARLEERKVKLEEVKNRVDSEIKEKVDLEVKKYVQNIINNIGLPFYIYTGKILQEHSLGSGLIFDADINNSDPQITIKPLNKDQEASYTLSSGQLSATVISLMLVLNKVYENSQFGTLLIDDPVQTLDEINTHSLVELLKYNFSEKQIILSTHEERYSNFIRYKYEKFGLTSKNINMKNEYQ